jgi:peptidyl-prolyl cis-trans isomerase C
MVPVFEKAAMSLKEGQVSDVVKSDFGFHIIKLTGKRPAGIRPLEEVKDQIKGAIMPTKQQEVFQKIKEELKKSAKITIKEDVLKGMGTKKEEGKADEKKPAEPAKPAEAGKK